MNLPDIHILLVDDHQIILDGLVTLFAEDSQIKILGQANTGREAVELTRLLKPQVVLMDLNMPEMNGMVAAAEIKKSFPDVKVIILSLHAEKSVIQHMMETGVDGYLIKTSDKTELLHGIHEVAKGRKYFSSDVTMSLSGVTAVPSSLAHATNDLQEKLALLSAREIEVLSLIADGNSNKEIGDQLFLSPRTIDAHRANLMKKLEIHKVAGLVRFAVKAGLV